MPDRDAASTVDDLTQRLADALRRAEAAEASLAEAQIRIANLEHALATAGVAAPASPPAAPSAPDTAPAPIATQAATTEPPVAALAAADAGGPDSPAAEASAPSTTREETDDPRDPELVKRLDAQMRALHKRGFQRDDVYFHKCPSCGIQAVAKFAIGGKPGGRDIDLCLHCGEARSWRRRPDREDREQDTTFDLATFLR